MAFLPLVSANSARSGRQLRKRRAVSTDPVRTTPPTRASVTSPRPSLVVGAGQELEDLARDAAVPETVREPPADQHRLGRGLEHDGVAGRQRGEHAAGGNRERKVPRRRDDHDAERLHAAVADLAGDLAERPGVVPREVDRLRDLGVGLGHRLGAVEHHRADQVAAPAPELGRARLEPRAARRRPRARPTPAARASAAVSARSTSARSASAKR